MKNEKGKFEVGYALNAGVGKGGGERKKEKGGMDWSA